MSIKTNRTWNITHGGNESNPSIAIRDDCSNIVIIDGKIGNTLELVHIKIGGMVNGQPQFTTKLELDAAVLTAVYKFFSDLLNKLSLGDLLRSDQDFLSMMEDADLTSMLERYQ